MSFEFASFRIYDIEDIRFSANFNISQLSKSISYSIWWSLPVFSLLVPAICDSRHKSGCGGQKKSMEVAKCGFIGSCKQTQAAPNGLEI